MARTRHQRNFGAAAKSCKGSGSGFQACMSRQLSGLSRKKDRELRNGRLAGVRVTDLSPFEGLDFLDMQPKALLGAAVGGAGGFFGMGELIDRVELPEVIEENAMLAKVAAALGGAILGNMIAARI